MRNKRDTSSLDKDSFSAEDRIRYWVLTDAKSGFYSSDAVKASGASVPSACNILREMVEDEILTRRRVGKKWEYFIKNEHDPLEYIMDKRGETILSKRYAGLLSSISRLQDKVNRLEDASRKFDMHVPCKCGRRLGLKLSVEEIYDSGTGCNEGDWSVLQADSVLGQENS